MHQTTRKAPTTRSKALDQYYTKSTVAQECLRIVQKLPHSYDYVIEPSAGDGAFYDHIQHRNKYGIDIAPHHPSIIAGNWLEHTISDSYKQVLVVGNPPFGQYHTLSTAFITHAFSFSNVQTIAFILPNVYKKHTRQKILPTGWRIVSITELPRDSFLLEGKNFHIPTSFFVFDKSQGKDLKVNQGTTPKTKDFTFSNKNNFDIFVFGASPTKITRNPTKNNRGHYLKAHIPVTTLIKNIQSIRWQGNSCANGGVYWLTKYEFIEQYANHHKYKNHVAMNNDYSL